eukprot:15485795-Alexandrium_andersonii.AAC.1
MARLARQKPRSVRARRATSSTKAGAGARGATKAPAMTGIEGQAQDARFDGPAPVSYTHLRAHETSAHL